MKKISKITLENFRAFSGKREINFNNPDDKPVDFVCIYGKNGFGKTSLFDGFEWFFTGEIHLLEKELQSNVSRYAGNVLKNRYASNDESAGINVEFSDGKQGRRTVVKRSDSINDYGKGMPSGEYKDMVNKKQILPHSKIDSFVYASKPTQMYEEWGNFWDPDNSQRKLFKTIYSVYKTIGNANEDCGDKLRKLLAELTVLEIESKVAEFNKAVSEYNKMVIPGIGKLEPLQYCKNGKIDIQNLLSGEKLVEPLKKLVSDCSYLRVQCEFLENYFKEYKEIEQHQEELFYKRKRWEAIIIKCKEKKEFLEKKKILLSKMNKIRKNRDSIANVFDERWFVEYQKYLETQTKYTQTNIDIQNNDLQRQNICKNIEALEESRKSYSLKLNNLSDNYIEWTAQIQELELQEKSILSENKQNKIIEKKDEVEKKIYVYEKELQYLLKASEGDYEKFVQSLEKDKLLQFDWIIQFYERIRKFKDILADCRKKEKEIKIYYEKIKEDIDNLDELLTLAKKEIYKEKTHICPVCKSPFSNMQELIDKLDLSVQQEILSSAKEQWDINKKMLKKAEEDYENECSNIREKLANMIYKNQQYIIDCNNKIAEYKREVEDNEKHLQEIKDKKEKIKLKVNESIGVEIIELTELCVKEAYEKKTTDLKMKIEECSRKIDEKQRDIDRLNIKFESGKTILEELEKNKNNFYEDKNNQERLEILEQRHLFSYDDYLSLVNEYDCEIKKILFEIKETEKLLQSYRIYSDKNIEKYSMLLNDLKKNPANWVETYEKYKNNVFKGKIISLKTITKYKKVLECKENLAQKKIEVLNKCLSNLAIKEYVKKYNRLEEERIELQKEKEFIECKLQIAKQIFLSAQKQLEEHIKKIFGGITISHIYEKIEPHKRFRRLQYQIEFSDEGKPELYVKVLNDEEDGVVPELFFSSAQLNAVALSVFLGGALSSYNSKVKTIFIDDPIGHFDDLNVLSFIDVIRTIISETDWQIIISTHEENFYEIMKVKLNPQYYNSKFLVFKDEGIVVEDEVM